jgi:DNA modification methylase
MAFLIADTRLTENSSWDERMLGEQLKILSELDLDFDLEAIGFEMPEIDLFIDGLNTVPEDDPDDRLPDFSASAVTVAGDVWQLGKHRVLCGNSLVSANYERLMEGAKADLVITDPPYNVAIDGHATGNGSIRHREFEMASGEMSSKEFTDFLRKAMIAARDHSANGSLAYYFMDWRHMTEILSAGQEVYTELLNLCVWAKNNGGMGSFYRSAHELVFLFKNGTGSHRNNVQLGKFGRNRTNVWNYPGANSFSRLDREGNLLALHPTPKPVALITDAVKDCTANQALQRIFDEVQPNDICPILPFSAPKPKLGDQLLAEYITEIESTWAVIQETFYMLTRMILLVYTDQSSRSMMSEKLRFNR